MKQTPLRVLSNRQISPGHYILEMASDAGFRASRPGQFVQILVDSAHEPFLPRPFSFLDVGPKSFQILYQVVGYGTQVLSRRKKGDVLTVTGPLGNGFCFDPSKKAILVGGGVGIPPLYHLAKQSLRALRSPQGEGGRSNLPKITVFLGGRNKALLHCEKEFKALGLGVKVATDDGSKGHAGVVTEIVDAYIKESPSRRDAMVYACGPTAMLKAVSRLASELGVACQVSVEECMPCGFGACLGCAIKVREDKKRGPGFRYAMSCTEGPVFDSRAILWG